MMTLIIEFMQRAAGLLFSSLLLTNVTLVSDSNANYRFQHSGTAWLGGDGSYPVRLPDGGIAWIFGDSLVKDSSGATRFVHGSIMVESTLGKLRLVTNLATGSLLEPVAGGTIIWPASGFVENGQLQVFGEEFLASSSGGFEATGHRYLYSFTLPGLARVNPPHEVYSGSVAWGHATLISGGYAYIYGNRELDGWTNTTYLARFKLGSSHGYWQFWDGSAFTSRLLSSRPLKTSAGAVQVAKLASVVRLYDGRYAAFTIDPFGATVDARYASNPWGPWSSKKVVYTLPTSDAGKSYLPRSIRSGTDRLRVAYSVPPPTSPIGVKFLKTA